MENKEQACCKPDSPCCEISEDAAKTALDAMAKCDQHPTVMRSGVSFGSVVGELRTAGMSYIQILMIASQIVEFIRTYGPSISDIVAALKKLYESISKAVS